MRKPLVDVDVFIGSVDSQIHEELFKLGNSTCLGLSDLFKIAFDVVSIDRFREWRRDIPDITDALAQDTSFTMRSILLRLGRSVSPSLVLLLSPLATLKTSMDQCN